MKNLLIATVVFFLCSITLSSVTWAQSPSFTQPRTSPFERPRVVDTFNQAPYVLAQDIKALKLPTQAHDLSEGNVGDIQVYLPWTSTYDKKFITIELVGNTKKKPGLFLICYEQGLSAACVGKGQKAIDFFKLHDDHEIKIDTEDINDYFVFLPSGQDNALTVTGLTKENSETAEKMFKFYNCWWYDSQLGYYQQGRKREIAAPNPELLYAMVGKELPKGWWFSIISGTGDMM